ncbi:MAG: DUF1015 domain-containing protein [Phycisphaerales bacterium]
MPAIYPFRAVQYHRGEGDVSRLVAPPYDVLDRAAKDKLLAHDQPNIVAIDLPHTPAKELGPAETYQAAGERYREWLSNGTLSRRATPAIFAYRQTFAFQGATHQRCGMACTLDAAPFGPRAGGGILPHEETFSGPKEDRFALMKATRAQLSPIFGLHADEKGRVVAVIHEIMKSARPSMTAKMADDVLHEVWAVDDPARVKAYAGALAGEDIFIADGHHRYTTGLNYIKHLESAGALPPDHPARHSMMVLVPMSDPGLVIGPTHRVLGGMKGYSLDAFKAAASEHFSFREIAGDAPALHAALVATPRHECHLGFYDVASKRGLLGTPRSADPLATRFASKPAAWRTLDVAIIQYLVVEAICQPKLNNGDAVKWAFPHSVDEVLEIARGHETGAGGGAGFAQLAVMVRPTPLSAVRDVSRAGELMPQKSTFFYPKLATGLFVNPLE